MGIATVRGAFRKFQGTIDATGDAPVLQGTVEVASIDTGDPQRDAHLTAPDFFDAESHPEITFHSDRRRRDRRRQDPPDRRDHDQGHHQADRADRRRRRGRHRPVGQRAHRLRGRGRDRPPRVRPQVEPDAPERQPARLQRGQAAASASRPSRRRKPMRVLAISGSLRAASHNTALLRAAAELAPDGVEVELYRGPRPAPATTTRTTTPTIRAARSRRLRERDRLGRRRPDLDARVQRDVPGPSQARGRLGLAPVRSGLRAVGQAGRR